MIQDILSGNITWIFALIIAITIHEFAHAFIAEKLGDPTARLKGRLTLNPLAHLDPLGTLMLLFFRFGWGKPVPVDPFNLRNPRRDSALISLAGPASNILLALLLSLFIRIGISVAFPFYSLIYSFLISLIILNVSLAIFNLIPLHPLDGGKILTGFLPAQKAISVENFLQQNSLLLLIIFLFPFFGSSLIFKIISPIINFLISLLLAGSPII